MKEPLFLKGPLMILASLSGITLLLIIQFSNFLLFHYIVETLSIIVGLLIFNVAWTGRDIIDNKPIIFLGIAYLFVAIMDSSHLISYRGMGILNLSDSNYTVQVWIAARYIEAISFLLVSIGIKKLYNKLTFLVYLTLTTIILFTIFRWKIFPLCYIEDTGLTNFKIISEYIIIGILFCAFIFFLYHRTKFHKKFVFMLSASIVITILSEFCFTLYTGVYDLVNGLGHILKVISYLFIYKVIFIEGIQALQHLLFQRLNSKQKETMGKLRESETLYQTLLESLPQSIFFIDRDLKYISCNRAYAQTAQLTKSEIIGRTIHDIYPRIEADRFSKEDLAIMDKGEIEEFEYTVIIKNKEAITQIAKVPIRDVDGSVIGLLGIFWDITGRKKIEADLDEYRQHLEDLVYERTLSLSNTNKLLEEEISERKQMEENLIRARNEAESANKAKSNFIANMSHDFRTPLNAILGNTQLFLRNPEIMDQYSSSVVRIHKSSLHLLSMINDILDLINIEAGKIESTHFCTGFTDFLTEITKVFRHSAEQKGLSFILENNTDPSLCVKVDEKHLHQVLYNLLSNAVKFTESGSVFLKTFYSKTSCKEIGNKQEKKSITFEVRDTGIGIEKEKIESIFEPFSQEKRKEFDDEGTGLGLAICRKLVKIMGGDLLVKSTPGSGSIFWFELKLEMGNGQQVIERTYRNESQIQKETDNTPLITPPKEELLKLLELEKVGNIMGIAKLIDKIEQDNDVYIPFVKKIKQLTESYQIEKLVIYINSFL